MFFLRINLDVLNLAINVFIEQMSGRKYHKSQYPEGRDDVIRDASLHWLYSKQWFEKSTDILVHPGHVWQWCNWFQICAIPPLHFLQVRFPICGLFIQMMPVWKLAPLRLTFALLKMLYHTAVTVTITVSQFSNLCITDAHWPKFAPASTHIMPLTPGGLAVSEVELKLWTVWNYCRLTVRWTGISLQFCKGSDRENNHSCSDNHFQTL